VKAIDAYWCSAAEHGMNASTFTARVVASTGADVAAALSAAVGALSGPLHGGAPSRVLKMLDEVAAMGDAEKWVKEALDRGERLMGFGHRVYKSYDPRAKIIKRMADLVFDVTGKNPLLDMALELERIALEDDYFVSRKLYPNVDFYSGLIYQAMGFPVDMFPVLFAIPRTAGWIAQWEEMLNDPDQKIVRPRQIYIGSGPRDYVSKEKRR
jgi:citrate synthase